MVTITSEESNTYKQTNVKSILHIYRRVCFH